MCGHVAHLVMDHMRIIASLSILRPEATSASPKACGGVACSTHSLAGGVRACAPRYFSATRAGTPWTRRGFSVDLGERHSARAPCCRRPCRGAHARPRRTSWCSRCDPAARARRLWRVSVMSLQTMHVQWRLCERERVSPAQNHPRHTEVLICHHGLGSRGERFGTLKVCANCEGYDGSTRSASVALPSASGSGMELDARASLFFSLIT